MLIVSILTTRLELINANAETCSLACCQQKKFLISGKKETATVVAFDENIL